MKFILDPYTHSQIFCRYIVLSEYLGKTVIYHDLREQQTIKADWNNNNMTVAFILILL